MSLFARKPCFRAMPAHLKIGCLLGLVIMVYGLQGLQIQAQTPTTLVSFWPTLQQCLMQRYQLNEATHRLMVVPAQQLQRHAPSGSLRLHSCEAPWLQPYKQGISAMQGMALFTFKSASQSVRIGLPLQHQHWRTYWVASAALPVGTQLRSSHLQGKQGWVDSLGVAIFTKTDLSQGRWSLVVPLQAGQVLHQQQLKAATLVQAHHSVWVEYQLPATQGGEGVTVTFQAEALSNGSLGERIQVQQLGFSKQRLWAVVVGEDRVQRQ